MNYIYKFIGISIMSLAIMSCGGGQSKGTKFAPEERQSSMTESEREYAIAQKKSELVGINIDTLLYGHGVKFSIVKPNLQGEDITQDISDRVAMKLLQIASQNGISGLGIEPTFVFGTEIMQTGRTATGTAPQKMMVQYELTFKVMNTLTGDVYATATQEVAGVGRSFAEANQNFVKEIKNTAEVQKMLQTASSRIIDWYNSNAQTIKNQIESAATKGEYELALALASSVPQQAAEAYKYAQGRIGELTKGLMHKRATDILNEMTSAISSARDEFEPAIGAYFKMIPTDAPEHAKAQKLYESYISKCDARRKQLEDKAERDENAARELERLKLKYSHETELAELETRKVTAKYTCDEAARKAEADARVAIAQANADAKVQGKRNSFFGSIGYAISGTADRVFKAIDKNM